MFVGTEFVSVRKGKMLLFSFAVDTRSVPTVDWSWLSPSTLDPARKLT